jgi:uncharacterized FlaG/YvyC family protein
MKMKTYDNNNNLLNEYTNQLDIISILFTDLLNDKMNKNGFIKKLNYKYNYTDNQTIIVITDNNCKIIIEDIPTYQGYVATSEILKLLKGGE